MFFALLAANRYPSIQGGFHDYTGSSFPYAHRPLWRKLPGLQRLTAQNQALPRLPRI